MYYISGSRTDRIALAHLEKLKCSSGKIKSRNKMVTVKRCSVFSQKQELTSGNTSSDSDARSLLTDDHSPFGDLSA